MVSQVKVSNRQTEAIIEAGKIEIQKMAIEETNITKAIALAVTERARVAVQDMAVSGAENRTRYEGTQNVGPEMGRTMMKQPTFNWEAEDKIQCGRKFRLEVNNTFKSFNMPQTEKIAIIKDG